MKKILLFVNPLKAAELAREITRELGRQGVETSVFAGEKIDAVDAALSLGGDGTVLFAARTVSQLKVPIFPINLGTLGFISAIPPNEWRAVFDDFVNGRTMFSRRLMLDVRVQRGMETIFQSPCLNDAIISASVAAKMIRLNVHVGAVSIGPYRSDGLITATPTGSTAYSVSAGGPILDPEMEAIVVNPICPFTLSNRPIVLPSDDEIVIEVEREQRSGVLLTMDGQTTETLQAGDRIIVRRAEEDALLVCQDSAKSAFYSALRTKLAWK
ncbi:MAG: NAD(+)/NADH kinase [Treponema sp.]|nr:NAD(+)/NADH kinase [Treponema sp.]